MIASEPTSVEQGGEWSRKKGHDALRRRCRANHLKLPKENCRMKFTVHRVHSDPRSMSDASLKKKIMAS